MGEVRLPRWIITQMAMPHGRRTSPKPVLLIPEDKKDYSVHGYTKSYPEKPGQYNPQEIDKVFEKWEYRFWCMCTWPPSTRILAECRACGHLGEQDMSVRQQHFKQSGCARRLCEAYKLLLKDMKCVICDNKAIGAKWGVPICSNACMEAWCEQDSQPPALKAALDLVGEVA